MSKRSIAIDDLLRVRFPQHAAVSPDGKRVVFALSRLDYETNEIRGALWLIPSTGGTPVPFTADEARDTSPKWSPDGFPSRRLLASLMQFPKRSDTVIGGGHHNHAQAQATKGRDENPPGP